MKSVRLISRLDIKGPNVVKGVHMEGLRVVGTPKELAAKYYVDGADEIIYMDIVASLYERNLDFTQLRSTSDGIFVPFTVGGGIRSVADINDALRSGADKVALNTSAIRRPDFLSEAAHNFGSQCIVLSVEAKIIGKGKWEAYAEGGREKTGVDAIEWIKRAISLGAGEIMLTSIDRDGTCKGYDIDLVREVSSFSPVPVIAHGGAGSLNDIASVISDGHADAVSASSIYHYGDMKISDINHGLEAKGIPVRRIRPNK